MALATLQQLRSFNEGEHPLNLVPGQIALNMATGNIAANEGNYQIYAYVGNGSNQRVDQDGTVLIAGGDNGRGWIRYGLRSIQVDGDTIFGDFVVSGSKLSFQTNSNGGSTNHAELVVPINSTTPTSGTSVGSMRWDTDTSIFQAWNGSKWDTTSKVVVSDTAPSNPSNGDLWLDPNPPVILYVYVVPTSGPASWVAATSGGGDSGLQPGNGVSANNLNQIDIINIGSY